MPSRRSLGALVIGGAVAAAAPAFAAPTPSPRLRSGFPALDAALAGGFRKGTLVLVLGEAGTGTRRIARIMVLNQPTHLLADENQSIRENLHFMADLLGDGHAGTTLLQPNMDLTAASRPDNLVSEEVLAQLGGHTVFVTAQLPRAGEVPPIVGMERADTILGIQRGEGDDISVQVLRHRESPGTRAAPIRIAFEEVHAAWRRTLRSQRT